MAGVGTAYVSVRVDTSKFEGDLEKMLSRLSTRMNKAGDQLGKDMVKGLQGTNWDNAFKGLESSANKSTGNVVKSLDRVENKVISVSHYVDDAADSMSSGMGGVGDVIRDLTRDMGDFQSATAGARREAGGINLRGLGGGGGGGSALRTAGDSAGFFSTKLRELAKEAPRSTALLTKLYNLNAFGGTALAGLVGGLSAAAQGIFALGANAASALPALAALSNGLVALGQVGAVIGLSMQGVGDAIGAGFDASTATADAAEKATKGLGDQMKKLVKPAEVSRDAIEAAKEAVLDSIDAIQDAREGVRDAARGIREAQEDLSRAYRDAAWSAEDAARRVTDAEADLAAAQVRTTAAQEALNDARAEALEQLEDIGFAAEDAALGEERASAALDEAYAKLLAVSELSPDNKMRQAAELAFKEAELNLRKAKDAREDADAAQAQAAETGIEGTEAYTSAQQDLVSAQEDQAAAAQAILDAQREQAQTAITDAEAIEDAERNVADAKRAHREAIEDLIDAQENYKDALDGVKEAQADYAKAVRDAAAAAAEANKGIRAHNAALAEALPEVDKFADAMRDLSPSQQEFVRRIIGMKDEYIDFRKTIAEPLFDRLLTAMDKVNVAGKDGKTIMDVLTTGLVGTSEALGDTAIKASELAANDVFQESLGRVMDTNNKAIERFGGAGVNLAGAFVQVADAARPLFRNLSTWVEDLTAGWQESATLSNKSGELTEKFKTAQERVRELSHFFGALWDALMDVGGAASTAANQFEWFTKKGDPKEGFIPMLTQNLKDFHKEFDKKDAIERFDQALQNLAAAGKPLKNLVIDPLLQLGSDKNLEKSFNLLGDEDAAKAMETLTENAGKAGPKLSKIVTHLLEIVAAMSESGSVEVFLGILEDVSGAVADIAGWAAKVNFSWIDKAADKMSEFADSLGLDTLSEFFDKIDTGGLTLLKLIGYITGTVAAYKILKKILVIGTSPFAALITGAQDFRKTLKSDGLKSAVKGIFTKKDKVAGPGDEAAAKKDGTDITEAFAKGIRAGMKFKDAAMAALRANVKTELDKVATAGARNAIKTGNSIMEGLEQGITTGKAEAIIKATDAGRDVAKAVGKGAGTMSPSTITLKDGNDVMEGLELGIKSGTAEATLAATRAGSQVGHAVGNSAKTAAATSSAGIGPAMGASATTSVGKSSGAMTGVLGKMMKPLTGIARGFGGLMTLAMGPFGIAIELIILLLPILIPLFKKLEEKTGIFSKTLEGVQNALGWVWDKIKFVFDWVKDNWPLLLTIITGPIGLAVSQIIKHWDDIKAAVDTAVQFIKDLLSGMWDKITEGWDKIVTWAGGLWESIKEKFTALIDKAKELLLTIWNGIKTGWNKLVEWSDIIENWVGDKVQGLVDAAKKVLLKIWNGITEAWTTLKEWAGGLWEDIKGKFNKFIEDAQLVLGTLWTIIETKWGDFKTWVGGLWGDIKTKVDKFVEDFSGALSGIWDGLKSGFWSAYVWVAKQVNDKLIGGINNILGFVGAPEIGFRLSEEKPAGMAEGGPVRGRGGPKSDLIPRMLSNGEYVMPTKAAQSIGQPTLDYMRKYGEIPPIGGLFGSIWNKMKDVAGALANGAEYAIKWVLGNLTEALPENVVGDLIRGIVTWASDKFTAFFKKKDEEMAVASGTSAGAYNGPPGGWTYPLSRRFSAYTFPGHSPSWAVDIGASGGTPVRAASAGKIVLVQDLGSTSYGKYMILSHAGGVTTLYAHLSKFLAGAGAVVKTGQTIGLSGNTGGVRGASGGYHLHFELRPSSSTIAAMAARGVPLARGGVVAPTRGGTLATLAEAGRSERVTPLDREGFTPAERRMIELMEQRLSSGGGGDTYQIHPSAPIDEANLADMVSRRVAWNRRRGARAG